MKKITLVLCTIAVVSALIFVAVAVAGFLFRPPDSPAVLQARQTAAIAEIERNTHAAEWWATFAQFLMVGLVVMLVFPVVFVLWCMATDRTYSRKVEILKLKRNWNLLEPDVNGNYPAYAHRASGELIRLEPGNSPFPPQYINGQQPQPLQRPQPGRVITVSANRQPIAAYAVDEPELPPRPEPLQISTPASRKFDVSSEDEPSLHISELETPENFRDLLPEIVTAVREGRGKTETLKALGLVGRKYSQASKLWEEIKAKSELSTMLLGNDNSD